MTTFTNEHLKSMEKTAEAAMEQLSEGKSAREIMAEIYMNGFEYKTNKQGLLMADSALQTLRDFNREFKKAVDNSGECLEAFAKKIEEGKTASQRCNAWLEIYTAVTAVNAQLEGENPIKDIDLEALVWEVDQKKVAEEAATPQLEAELKEKAMAALSDSAIMYNALVRQAESIDELAGAGISELMIQMGSSEIEYEGILSMIAYVKIKNGEFKEMPTDMTLDQAAVAIAASIEQMKIMEQVGNGKMAAETATVLLQILGCVVIIQLAVIAAVLGVSLASSLFGAVMIIPAVLVIGAGIFAGVSAAFAAWEKGSEKIVEKGGKIVRASVDAVVFGMKKVAAFVKEKILPVLAEAYGKAKAFVLSVVKRETEAGTEAETETDEAGADMDETITDEDIQDTVTV